jgi:hypothetical protein
VRLPTSNMILDRSTIAQHLLNDETGCSLFFTFFSAHFSAHFSYLMIPFTYTHHTAVPVMLYPAFLPHLPAPVIACISLPVPNTPFRSLQPAAPEYEDDRAPTTTEGANRKLDQTEIERECERQGEGEGEGGGVGCSLLNVSNRRLRGKMLQFSL